MGLLKTQAGCRHVLHPLCSWYVNDNQSVINGSSLCLCWEFLIHSLCPCCFTGGKMLNMAYFTIDLPFLIRQQLFGFLGPPETSHWLFFDPFSQWNISSHLLFKVCWIVFHFYHVCENKLRSIYFTWCCIIIYIYILCTLWKDFICVTFKHGRTNTSNWTRNRIQSH